MYKSLSPSAFGVSGRQSELIELALTHGYRSIEVDVEELLKKADKQSIQHAARFLVSAQLKLGSFELPIQWRGTEAMYKSELSRLQQIGGDLAAAGGRVCHATVLPASDELPYHENFEMHRQRLAEIGQALAQHDCRLGVRLLSAPAHRAQGEFQFIHEAEALATLVKSIGEKNVGIYLDTWNWHFGGGTPEQLAALDLPIVAVSIADAPSDATAESITESQRTLPGDPPVIDNAAYLKTAHELGCNGPVAVLPDPSSFAGLRREAIVQKCSAVLEDLWEKAELKPKAVPALTTTESVPASP